MENKIKYILVLVLFFVFTKSNAYIELGSNYFFFKEHRQIKNVYTQSIYLSLGKHFNKDSNYRYFFSLGQLPQHIKLKGYDYYRVHNYITLGLAKSFNLSNKFKVDAVIKYNNFILPGSTIFNKYQNKTSSYFLGNNSKNFMHNKGIELGIELKLMKPNRKFDFIFYCGSEYKFSLITINHPDMDKVEEKVLYYSTGFTLRKYFGK